VTTQAQQSGLTFILSSSGPGKGAELGGLAGADALCQALGGAAAPGARDIAEANSWNSSHAAPAFLIRPRWRATGGAGLFLQLCRQLETC